MTMRIHTVSSGNTVSSDNTVPSGNTVSSANTVSRRSIVFHSLVVLSLVITTAGAATAKAGAETTQSGPETVTARDVVTSIQWNEPLLADLGIAVKAVRRSAASPAQHRVSVLSSSAPAFAGGTPWSLRVALREDGHFAGFRSGRIQHEGGFELHWNRGHASFLGFELRPGKTLGTFQLADARGDALLWSDMAHHAIEGDRLHVFNADLRLSPDFAERLGNPLAADMAVGMLAVVATLDWPESLGLERDGLGRDSLQRDGLGHNGLGRDGAPGPQRGSCPPNWATPENGLVQDVALIDIGSVQTVFQDAGRLVLAPSAALKNVGTADVPWHTQFGGNFPPYDNDQHPLLTWSMFKVEGGAMRQLGVSDVKHAFLTVNTGCTGCGADNNILGLGCEDVYSQATNTSNVYLGPREEINPWTGVWSHCDIPSPGTVSHFDTDGDCVQDHFGGDEDRTVHGLVIEEVDVMDPEAQYYFQVWYLVRDDVNIFNTMGWRQVTPITNGSWAFPFATEFVQGSPLDAWVDPTNPGPNAMNATLAHTAGGAVEGHVQLAVRASTDDSTDPPITTLDYTLMNHDNPEGITRLEIPIPDTPLLGSTFTDLPSGWSTFQTSTEMVVAAQSHANALAWGRSLGFRLTFEGRVTAVDARVSDTSVGSEGIPTLSVTLDSVFFSDSFESGDTAAWSFTDP